MDDAPHCGYFSWMADELSGDGLTYAEASALLGVTSDAIAKRVAKNHLRTVGARRVARGQVETERAELLSRLQATDARRSAGHAADAEQMRRLRARVAALDEEVAASYRAARQARQERDDAVVEAEGYVAALAALTDTARELRARRASR